MIRLRRCLLAALLATAPAAVSAQPAACDPGGAFPDVPESHPFCDWIHQLDLDQIAEPCDGTNFCPDAPVTRAQLALFVYRLTRGTATSQVDADTLDGIDSSSFGDITGITTMVGSGLAGGAASGDPSLSIPTGGINSDRIENGSVLFEDLAGNSCGNNTVIKRSGSVWTCATVSAPVAYIHTTSDTAEGGFPNYLDETTFLNHASLNNNPNAIVFAIARNVGPAAALAVDFVEITPGVERWRLRRLAGVFSAGETYNILFVLP